MKVQHERPTRITRFWPLLVGVVLCVAVYYPGLDGDFIFDDGPNIVENGRLQISELSLTGVRQAALSTDSGMLKRPVSMLSFWLNYYTTGLDPFYFKLTNLVIHLLNGIGLFWLTRLLLGRVRPGGSAARTERERDWIAAIVASIWLLHPLNLTGVLYVVQRMTSLSATFVILGLLSYVLGRERLARDEPGFRLILLGLAGFGALATLTKENGALLALYVAAVELFVFRFATRQPRDALALKALVIVIAVVPVFLAAAFILANPDWLPNQYRIRNFTLYERLLTQARVLWLYLGWALVPRQSALGLFHDDVAVSRGLLDPPTTIFAIVALALACAGAVRLRQRAPLFAFAVAWYLFGHVLESSFIGLEMIFEHRNYLPVYGPILAAVVFVIAAVERISAQWRFALPAAFLLAAASVTLARAQEWADLNTLRMALVRHHPESSRSNYEAGVALGTLALAKPELAPELYDDIKTYFERAAELDSTAINPLFGLLLLNGTNGKEIEPELIQRLSARLATMPLPFTTVGAFRSLVDWLTKGSVRLPSETVAQLFDAALTNPTADHRTRASLLSALSGYYYNAEGAVQEAVALAMAAVEEDPAEPAHHISLADLAIKLGNLELAARELHAIERADRLNRFGLQRMNLVLALQEARGAVDAQPNAPDSEE